MKRILAILGLLLVTLLMIGAWILLGAHLQIRSLHPPLPSPEQAIAAVSPGSGPVRVNYVNTSTQRKAEGDEMGHVSFVFEWADGRRFLIDAGMDPEEAVSFGKGMEIAFGAEPAVGHGTVPAQMGLGARRVLGVAFTHLHSDHTQGLVALCGFLDRMLPVFQTPWQFEHRNHTTDMGFAFLEAARAASTNEDCGVPTRLSVSNESPVYPVPGFPGLVAIPMAGHTPGSTAYLARVGAQGGPERYWLFSGDVTNTRRDLIENRRKAWWYSLAIVPEDPERLDQMRPWLATLDRDPRVTVVVSHDFTELKKTAISPWSATAEAP